MVGVLQFEVLEYRLKNEYNVDIRMQSLPYSFIRWIENEDCDPKALNLTSDTQPRSRISRAGKLLLFTNSLEHHLGRGAQQGASSFRGGTLSAGPALQIE